MGLQPNGASMFENSERPKMRDSRDLTTHPCKITAMTKVRQLTVGGALMVGVVALLSIGIGENIHSSPATHVQPPVAFGNGVSVLLNPKTGKVVVLGSGVTFTMNAKTGQIVSVNSVPRADR
jgi:hypothetical protein